MSGSSEEGQVATAQVDIHPQAIVHPTADLDVGVTVGAWTLIGPGVRIGARAEIGPGVLIERETTIGAECEIYKGAVLGTNPQDLKYQGEETHLEVGDRTVIREYATLNRGTKASGLTSVGKGCLLMAYVHVAHDCRVGDQVILSNAVNLAGHVQIGHHAIVGGLVGIHQFVRIGMHSFVGGGSGITKDVVPFCRVSGTPPKPFGLNSIGLERSGFPPETRATLKQAYRILFLSNLNVSQGLARIKEEVDSIPEVEHFLAFIENSERGVVF